MNNTREIKFRFWGKAMKPPQFINLNKWSSSSIADEAFSGFFSNSLIIPQQFTGLKDSKGKEIYEGDIVKTLSSNNGYYSEVVWCDSGQWGFKSINLIHPERSGKTISYTLCYGCSKWEVIGNIFENPELLK